MAKIKYDKITRFDKGIRPSARLSGDGEFQMVKGFDIFSDPLKAIPTGGWSEELTVSEKLPNFRAVEGEGDYLYAMGYATSNWLGPNWQYRVRLTASTSTAKVHYYDLSNMPANFWDNATGITVTSITNTELDVQIGNLDTDAQTGYMIIGSTSDVYVYYGATSGPNNSAQLPTISDTFNACAWLENNENNDGSNALDFDDGPDGTFTDGVRLEYALTNNIYTDGTQFVANEDAPCVILLTTGSTVPTSQNIITFGGYDLALDGSSRVTFDMDTTGTNLNIVGTTVLQPNTTYLIVVDVFDGGSTVDAELWVNNVSQGTDSRTGAEDLYATQNRIYGDTNLKIEFVQFWDDQLPTNGPDIYYDMWMDNSNYWTTGSEEEITDVTLAYDGIACWQRLLTGGDWEIITGYGGTAVDLDWYATNGKFNPNNGSPLFVNTSLDNHGGLAYYGSYDTFAGFDPTVDTIGLLGIIGRTLPTMAEPEDKQKYLGFFGDVYQITSTTASEESINTFSYIESMNNFIDSLAFISTQNDKAWVEYWNLNDPESDQVFDLGRGKGRVIVNAGGTLMAAINNFIDDDNRAGTKQTMDIRYLDGLDFKTLVSIEAGGSMDGYYSNQWDQPIGQHTAQIDSTATLFYAKIPTNTGLTEFNEGLWALSKNKVTNELSLSLYAETPSMDVNYLTSVGNIPYIVHSEDGSVESLTGDYDQTAEIITKIFNGRNEQSKGDSEEKKKLVGVQVTHEKLSSGQTITVYFRKDGDTAWTKIGENTVEDSLAKEHMVLEGGTALPIYREIEYKITTTGGSSAITGFQAKYEVLTDNYA